MGSSSLMVTGDATVQPQDFSERCPSNGSLAPPLDCFRRLIEDDRFERQRALPWAETFVQAIPEQDVCERSFEQVTGGGRTCTGLLRAAAALSEVDLRRGTLHGDSASSSVHRIGCGGAPFSQSEPQGCTLVGLSSILRGIYQ